MTTGKVTTYNNNCGDDHWTNNGVNSTDEDTMSTSSSSSSSTTSTSDEQQLSITDIKTETDHCYSCRELITDRHLLKFNGQTWHTKCLRCCICQTILDRDPSCFLKDNNVYCRIDYHSRIHGSTSCAKCCRHIQPSDWVRRARQNVYHLACFACDTCKRQLSTGEEFALHENRVLCKTHFMELVDGSSGSNDELTSSDPTAKRKKCKSKRVRTTFTEDQLQILQANFNLDSNPDGQDLERIAQITGLSKRVTQVWFQNSRARQKRHHTTSDNNDPDANRYNYATHTKKRLRSGSTQSSIPRIVRTPGCPSCGMIYCMCDATSQHGGSSGGDSQETKFTQLP